MDGQEQNTLYYFTTKYWKVGIYTCMLKITTEHPTAQWFHHNQSPYTPPRALSWWPGSPPGAGRWSAPETASRPGQWSSQSIGRARSKRSSPMRARLHFRHSCRFSHRKLLSIAEELVLNREFRHSCSMSMSMHAQGFTLYTIRTSRRHNLQKHSLF